MRREVTPDFVAKFFVGLGILLIVIGVTLFFVNRGLEIEKTVTIQRGGLELLLMEKKNAGEIFLKNPSVMSDEEGVKQRGYTFSLTNITDTEKTYQIFLDDHVVPETMERIPESKMRYRILHLGGFDRLGVVSDLGTNRSRLLVEGKIAAGETARYQLAIWFSSQKETLVRNSVFSTKLRIETDFEDN